MRLTAGGGLLALVVAGVDADVVSETLVRADVRLVAPGVLGLVAMHAVTAAGWRAVVAAGTPARLRMRDALRVHYAAQALGAVTPGNIGGDVFRVTAMRTAGHLWTTSVGPVVVQRATSYGALALLSLAGMALLGHAGLGPTIVLVGMAVSTCLAATAWLLLAPPVALRRIAARLARSVGVGPVTFLDDAAPRWGRAALIGLLNGLAFHAGSVVLTWLVLVGVDRSMATTPVLAALVVARLTLAVPISPSGIGFQEGALVALLSGVAVPTQPAVAGMLLARLAMVVTTLVGIGIASVGAGKGELATATR
ncbi:MAG: lysylphosphatidylglycerol synthase transmembrane domain-containing protein [Candidatus Limnocylindria bacterium]